MKSEVAGYTCDVRSDGVPGRLTADERRAALAAPAEADGFSSRWWPVSGLSLHVRERLGGTGTGCLLLHGLAVSHRYLIPTARCLTGRPVFVPDLPGFGLSDKPRRVYDVGDHAETLACWLDSLGGQRVCAIGNSFGCQVAVELAVRRPDLVEALVLVGPTVDPAARSVARQVGRWVLDLAYEDWRQVPILAADARDAGPRRIAATLRLSVRDRIDAKLPAVRVPVLLVRGEHDRLVTPSWLTRAAGLASAAPTVTLPGAAHNAVTTAGPQVAATVSRFLATVGRTTA
jgi:pimeloyl-ACP methyl ester carboxylesterase